MWFRTLDGLDSFDGGEIRSYIEKYPGYQHHVNCIINDTRNAHWVGADAGLACSIGFIFHPNFN